MEIFKESDAKVQPLPYFKNEKWSDKDVLAIVENVTCRNPFGSVLFTDVSFKVGVDQNVLIYGPSGCGKSSMLRVIGALWNVEVGNN